MPWTFSQVNSNDGVYFAMLLTLRESRRTSDPALLRVRSKKTTTSPSDALALNLSGFCNDGFAFGSVKKKLKLQERSDI